MNAGTTLNGKAADAVVRQLMVALGSNILLGDILAVRAGGKETATIQLQIAVDRKKHTSGIGTGKDAALGVGVDMYHIVPECVLTLKGKAKIL